MDQEPEVIRQQMEETRHSLADKLEKLETQVVGTVHDAKAAVTDTVTSVKDAVKETVDAVKGSVSDTVTTVKDTVRDSVDIAEHTRQHPWLMVGASFALGVVSGRLLGGPFSSRPSSYGARHPEDWGIGAARASGPWPADGPAPRYGSDGHNLSRNGGTAAPAAPAEPGLLAGFAEQFKPELSKLKGMAIGTLLGFAREMLNRSVPQQLAGQLGGLVDDVTRKLGGEPVRGPLLADRPADRESRPATLSL